MAPSSPLVVKMVGMDRRQLSWQRGLQGGLTFLLGAVELDEPRQRQACLKLDSIHGHGKHTWYRRTSLGRNGLLTELAA